MAKLGVAVAVALWISGVTAFYWFTWHCSWGISIWCPATRGGDYGLDAQSLADHISVPALAGSLFIVLIYFALRRRHTA